MRKVALFLSLYLVAALLRAVCPTPQANAAWSNGFSVNYTFPPSNPPPAYTALSIDNLGISSDINSAFNQWTYANQSQNITNVNFVFNSGSGAIRVYAYQVNSPGVPGLDPGMAAGYTEAVF